MKKAVNSRVHAGKVPAMRRTTRRKQIERTPRASEPIFRSLFRRMGVAVQFCELIFDDDGRANDALILDVNTAYAEHSGLRREQLVGRRMKDVFPIVEQAWLDRYAEVIHSGETTSFEEYNASLDKWFRVDASLVSGNRFAAFVSDITRSKKAEGLLRASENKYKIFFERSNVGKSITKTSGELEVNQALCDMLGYSKAELQSRRWQDITHPEDIQLTQQNIDLLLSGKQDSARFTKRFLHRNGSVVWGDLSSTLYRDQSGRPIHLITAIVDITERKRTEQALRELNLMLEQRVAERTAALRESMDRLKMILTAAHVVAWELDPVTDELLEIGPVGDVFRKPDGTVHRTAAAFFESVHPDDRAKLRNDLKVAMLGKERDHSSEFRIMLPDGQTPWLMTAGSVERDASGRVVRLRGVTRDITERKRAEEALAELQRQVLSISEREQRRIGYDLHDGIGQSLTGIGYLVSAVQQTIAAKSAPEAAELKRVEKMIGETVQQTHDLSRSLAPFKLKGSGFVAALKELAILTHEVFGISCRYVGPQTVELTDESVSNQLFWIAKEAVHNSAKHSKAKAISIRLSRSRGGIVMTIKDNGIGLAHPPANGTGMGLRIMKYRASIIGAVLKIVSVRGRGTTVTCYSSSPNAFPW